jgi:plastocyanin
VGPHLSPVIHNVIVGDENGLAFNPNQLNANIGNKVIFTFYSLNHTLTWSTLTAPCMPSNDFDSGFNQFNPGDGDGLTLTLTVNSLDPQWFFCCQNVPFSHCHAGMVFALNPGGQMSTFLGNVVLTNTITPIPSLITVTITQTIQVGSFSQSMASVYSMGPIIVVGTGGLIGNST